MALCGRSQLLWVFAPDAENFITTAVFSVQAERSGAPMPESRVFHLSCASPRVRRCLTSELKEIILYIKELYIFDRKAKNYSLRRTE